MFPAKIALSFWSKVIGISFIMSCTPEVIKNDPLNSYFVNSKKGNVFFRNHNGEYVVVNSGFSKDKKSILILTRSNYVYREQKNGDFSPIPISSRRKCNEAIYNFVAIDQNRNPISVPTLIPI